MKTTIKSFVISGTILTLLLSVACNTFNNGNKFYSDKYHLEVKLPPGWAAAEVPENLVPPASYEGLVAFNSWGQDDFWARGVSSDTDTESIIYGPSVVAAQVPDGGAYVALVGTGGPPYIDDSPTEYELDDLSGL